MKPPLFESGFTDSIPEIAAKKNFYIILHFVLHFVLYYDIIALSKRKEHNQMSWAEETYYKLWEKKANGETLTEDEAEELAYATSILQIIDAEEADLNGEEYEQKWF